MRKLLEYDSVTKTTKTFHVLDRGREWAVEVEQDVSEIIERNKALYAAVDQRARFAGDGFHMVASIPMVEYFKMRKAGICDHEGYGDTKDLARMLDDRDYLGFRTRPGRLL